MADDNIDKALPNVEQTIKVPGEEEIAAAETEVTEDRVPSPDDIEVTQTDDGGAEINFEPGAVNQAGTESHFDNLADLLPDEVLGDLASTLYENYMQYKQSRKDWEDYYVKGFDLLRFKYKNPTQPFTNASGATHPVLAEAVTQFQAHAYKELLPATGPVHTQIMGTVTKQKEEQLAKLNRERQKQLDQTNELKRKGIYKSRTNNLGVDSDLASKVDALTRQYKQNSFKAGNTTQNTIVFNGTATEESVSFLGSGGLRTAEQLQYGSFVSLQEDGFKQQIETEVDSYVGISILRQQAAESDLNSMFTGYDQSVYNPYMPTKDFIQRDAINRRMRF